MVAARRGAPQGRRNRRVLRQRCRRIEPAFALRHLAQHRQLAPAHVLPAGDLAVGFAAAQADEHLSILEHLDSPAAHRHLHGIKIPQRSDWPVRFEMSALPRLAPICRKSGGAITPTTPWRLYAGNPLAPIRRKFLGSYVPEDDTVHADVNAVFAQNVDEGGGGELAALVGIHDLRHAVTLAIASSSASTAASAARLIDSRHARTRRLAQSSTTVRYTKPGASGCRSCPSPRPDWVGRW